MKSTLVKIFLVLNLLLCAAVIGVSVKTFADRELIKARTVIHRENINDIAENLDWGETLSWEDSSDRKTTDFQLPKPQSMDEMSSFSEQLDELAGLANQRVEQLGAQFAELEETKGVLEETRSTLATRIAELATTKSQITALENEVEEARNALPQIIAEAKTLERETASLEEQISLLDRQLTDQQTQISQVSRDLELRTRERDRIQELLEACLRPAEDNSGEVTEWHQKTARILAVEPDWNYVVINKGEVDVLPMYLEAFVHRDDEFVGKVRVIQVENSVALAEVIKDSVTPGMTIQTGDTIFF